MSDRAPTVLVILVVRDAAAWLRECLQALAAQSYPRLGVLAIDDASSDGSHEILVQALGADRVVARPDPGGMASAFNEAIGHPAASAADHLLLLHHDVVLDPEAVTRLVDATQLQGVENVGIVGAKVVDHDDPRRLRDVGRSADRFGHPYTPLQSDEIDQGQFDRVLEVLSVDSCAMLIGRDVWQRVGLFDVRLGDDDGDLDLCWRARVAGWQVLMTPLARVQHRAAGEYDERPSLGRSRRFEEDRAALAASLKNYGPLNLLWIVPLGLGLSLVRFVFLMLSRRFEEGTDLAIAIGWNVLHLPGTLARRWRVQRARRTKDGSLRRFTESAGLRIPRWFQTAERFLEEQRELGEEEEGQPVARRLRHRTASLFAAHPVLVTSFVAAVVGGFAIRHIVGSGTLAGGALPTFPSSPSGFLAELASAVRTTGLGGALAASPALGAMGGLSALLLGSTSLAQKAMLIAGPFLAAGLAYRAAVRVTGRAGPSALAAAAYGASAVVLWAFSEGRLSLLVALAVLPAIVERLETAFGRAEPADDRGRFVTGLGVTLAVGIAFEPGIVLAVAVLVVVQVVGGDRRLRGLGWSTAGLLAAAVLLFSFVPTLVAGGGAALGAGIGQPDPWALSRTVLGDAPGAWAPAWFLPVAALVGLALAGGERRGPAVRAATAAVIATGLAWGAAAGYLPAPVANPPVYVALAAVCEVMLVALGLASVLGGMGRAAFGFRQVGAAILGVSLAAGLSLQALAAAAGGWAVGGPEQIPAAWAIVDPLREEGLRVLWIGPDAGTRLPAPGGDPESIVMAGGATLRYALTGRDGVVAVDTGRPLQGPGADALHDAMAEILSGRTSHGGALLAPFGARFLVAEEGTLATAALERLAAQSDLNLLPSAGLMIWRNDAALPPAGVLRTTLAQDRLILSPLPEDIQRLEQVPSTTLDATDGGWDGPTDDGDRVVVSTEYDADWTLVGDAQTAERSFGWSTTFETDEPRVSVRYDAQLPRTVATWLLAVLWLAALWITRKPVRR